MIEIDEGKAMVAYWGNGFDMIMPFSEFKDRYGHFYRKRNNLPSKFSKYARKKHDD